MCPLKHFAVITRAIYSLQPLATELDILDMESSFLAVCGSCSLGLQPRRCIAELH